MENDQEAWRRIRDMDRRLRRIERATPTDGIVTDAATLDGAFSSPPASAKYIRSSTQTIPDAAYTVINWSGAAPPDGFNEAGISLAGANSSHIVVPGGMYIVGTLVTWGINSSGSREIVIDKDENFSADDVKGSAAALVSVAVRQSAEEIVYIPSLANIRVMGWQNSGGDLEVSEAYFWVVRLYGGGLK